MYRLS